MTDRETQQNDMRDADKAASEARPPRRASVPAWVAWAVAGALIAGGFLGLDRWFYERVSIRFGTPNQFDRDPYAVTALLWDTARYFGSITGALIAYFVVLALHPKGWRAANTLMVAILAADGLGVLVKDSVCRVRPNQAASHLTFMRPFEGLRVDVAKITAQIGAAVTGTTSADDQGEAPVCFPSGEATAAFALATALSLLYPKVRPFVYAVAAVVALARVLGGAHYISDVTAGAVIGTLATGYVFAFLQRRRWRVFV